MPSFLDLIIDLQVLLLLISCLWYRRYETFKSYITIHPHSIRSLILEAFIYFIYSYFDTLFGIFGILICFQIFIFLIHCLVWHWLENPGEWHFEHKGCKPAWEEGVRNITGGSFNANFIHLTPYFVFVNLNLEILHQK